MKRLPAFTLTELLAVLALTGIVTGIAFWMYVIFAGQWKVYQERTQLAEELVRLDGALRKYTREVTAFGLMEGEGWIRLNNGTELPLRSGPDWFAVATDTYRLKVQIWQAEPGLIQVVYHTGKDSVRVSYSPIKTGKARKQEN